MTKPNDIVFEDHWYNASCDETELYFMGSVSYLNGKYPEADGCTFCLRWSGKDWNPEDARVEISPFETFENTTTDYDWCEYDYDEEFITMLHDMYEKGE